MNKNKIYQDGTIEDISDEYFNFNRDGANFLVNRSKFIYCSDSGMKMSCRAESRKNSSKKYWVAYKRADKKLNKRYLGSPDQVSIETLEQVCTDICKSIDGASQQPSKSSDNTPSEQSELTAKLDKIVAYIEKQQKYLNQVPPATKTGQKRGDTPRYKYSSQLVEEIAAMLSD